MFSAVKVNGRRLYEYARAGETVKRPERQATVSQFTRTDEPVFSDTDGTQRFRFEVHVSKGTYIRTLAVDVGKTLGSCCGDESIDASKKRRVYVEAGGEH